MSPSSGKGSLSSSGYPHPKRKSMKWAILGAVLFPLASYVYVAQKGRKKYGWIRGILVSIALGMGYRFSEEILNSVLESLLFLGVFTYLATLAFHGYVVFDVYRRTKQYKEIPPLASDVPTARRRKRSSKILVAALAGGVTAIFVPLFLLPSLGISLPPSSDTSELQTFAVLDYYSGKPIQGAEVYVNNIKQGITDQDGKIRLNPIPQLGDSITVNYTNEDGDRKSEIFDVTGFNQKLFLMLYKTTSIKQGECMRRSVEGECLEYDKDPESQSVTIGERRLMFLSASTGKPLQNAEIFLLPDERNPICVTDKNGVCLVNIDNGQRVLGVKTYTTGAGGEKLNTLSYRQMIQLSSDQKEVTFNIPVLFHTVFEVKDKRSSSPLAGAKIFVDGKLYGNTDRYGTLKADLGDGPHKIRVEYTDLLGQLLFEELNVNIENRLRNNVSIPMQISSEPTSPEEPPPASKQLSHEELVAYALDLINRDRAKNGLNPVTLGSNIAAQKHAEDMLKNKFLSHWGSDGAKPYMRYTLAGGSGYVAENAGITGYSFDEYDPCASKYVVCKAIDPMKEIENHQYNMMYNDAASNWGHRDNILNKWHNKVNLGIAYNEQFFAYVQDFEGDYIVWRKHIIVTSTGNIEMSGTVNLRNFKLFAVVVYYDPLPKPSISAPRGAYDAGKEVDVIYPPPPLGYYYESPNIHIANKWFSTYGARDYEDFEISFSISNTLQRNGDGVYSIYLFTKNASDEQLNLTTHSLKYENGRLSSFDSSTVGSVSSTSSQEKVGKFTVTTNKSTYVIGEDSGISIQGTVHKVVLGMLVSVEFIDPNDKVVTILQPKVQQDGTYSTSYMFPYVVMCKNQSGTPTDCYNHYNIVVGVWKIKANYLNEVATTSFNVIKQ
jgi:hypothetical protein